MWCKPMVGSRRFLRPNSTAVDNFLGFMVQELVGLGITTILPKAHPVSSPLFTFRKEMLIMCCIEHRLIKSEEENERNIWLISVKAKRGILPSRAAQDMWLSR